MDNGKSSKNCLYCSESEENELKQQYDYVISRLGSIDRVIATAQEALNDWEVIGKTEIAYLTGILDAARRETHP